MVNAVVVGGGITGLFAALRLRESFENVTVIEKSGRCGGLLRSTRNEEGVCFDYGTHFLKESGIPEVDDIAYDLDPETWLVFDHNLKAGNYYGGKLNTQSLFVRAGLLPPEDYSRGIVDLMHSVPGEEPPANLEEFYVKRFGRAFTNDIFGPISRKVYGLELAELASGACALLSQVRFLAFTPEMTRRLKQDPFFDERLAFHDASCEGYSGLKNYYPRSGGIEAWVEHFLAKIERAGIDVLTETEIQQVVHSGGRVRAVELAGGRSLKCDQLVWTGSVPGFLSAANIDHEVGTPPMIHVALFHYVFDRPFATDLHYLSNYDPDYRSFRTTLYSNIVAEGDEPREPYHCTVEVFSPEPFDAGSLVETLPAEMLKAGALTSEARVASCKLVDLNGCVPVPTCSTRRASPASVIWPRVGCRMRPSSVSPAATSCRTTRCCTRTARSRIYRRLEALRRSNSRRSI